MKPHHVWHQEAEKSQGWLHHEHFTHVMSVSLRSRFFRGIRMELTWLQRTAMASSASSETSEESSLVFTGTIFGTNMTSFQNLPPKSTCLLQSSKQNQPRRKSSAITSEQNLCWRQTARHETKLMEIAAKTTVVTDTIYCAHCISDPGYLIMKALCYITFLFLSPGQAPSAKGTNAEATSHVSPLQK